MDLMKSDLILVVAGAAEDGIEHDIFLNEAATRLRQNKLYLLKSSALGSTT